MKTKIEKNCDTPPCEKCKQRTATVSGNFNYSPDSEPYLNGVREKSLVSDGDAWLIAFVCDNCGHVQGFHCED